jgi:hypothetical protein
MGGPPSAPNSHLRGVTEVTRHSAGTVPTHHAQAVKKRTYPGIGGNLAHALGAAQGDADSVSGQNGIFTDHRHSFRHRLSLESVDAIGTDSLPQPRALCQCAKRWLTSFDKL